MTRFCRKIYFKKFLPHLIKQSYSNDNIVRYIYLWGYTAINTKRNLNRNQFDLPLPLLIFDNLT